jgi:HlyD family secretion protein
MKRFLVLLVILALGGGGVGYWYWQVRAGGNASFRTVPVERGPFLATIAATGTIEPEEVIDVGAQVVGRIDRFGQDPRSANLRAILAVACGWPHADGTTGLLLSALAPHQRIDYGSPVEEGTVLAQLDPSLYQAQVDQARANLLLARSNQLQLEANFRKADRDWGRAQYMAQRGAYAQADFDQARANLESTQANVEVGKAAIAKAEADLKLADTNLGYTTIRSPVKGVIVDRRVNTGQTVVASLSAPSLFLIAKDLKKLQVWASVNEADIGQIKPGQEVRFTVDAYPNEDFVGQVADDQPRLNATMTQNVVTYTVVVNTDNSSGRLLPYQTTNLQFVVHQRSEVLLVPNSALRWRPRSDQIAPDARADYLKAMRKKANPRAAKKTKKPGEAGTVWVADDGFVRPIRVRFGSSDGTMTEILEGDLHEGLELVIGEEQPDSGGSDSNPFTPKLFGGKKKE